MNLDQQIRDWLEGEIKNRSFFLVDLEIKSGFKRMEIAVFLDSMEGIQIEECAEISRKLSNWLEEGDLVVDAYLLEVSSPGIDAPINQDWQFEKNKGRRIKVWMKEGENMEGVLEKKEGNQVFLFKEKKHKHLVKIDKVATQVSLDQIDKIKVQVSF